MKRRWLACLLLATATATGAVTQEQLIERAGEVYAKRLSDLRDGHRLDADARFGERVDRIAGVLIAQAKRDYPDTAPWPWEVHTTTDTEQNGDCMAGGKILVGQSYAQRLELSEAELAMLLAHEIAHAALRHNLKEYELALQLDPGWAARPFLELEDAIDNDDKMVAQLAPLGLAQEAEADREGLLLAWRAGWPADRLASYFKKLSRADGWSGLRSASHPSPASRWSAARALAATLAR
jgi:predicted Zn-dependent protease